MVDLRFDFRDLFKAGRYAFSGKKMAVHFGGIAIWYTIYEILLYLSVLISGQVKEFWRAFGLLPICPFMDFSKYQIEVQTITYVAMGIGYLVAFIIFFVTSTMVSKITLQQLRGDDFYSMRDSAGFARKQWKTIFGAFLALVAIFIFCIIWPVGLGLLGKIPAVGKVITMLAAFLLIPAFLLGLLMALVVVAFVVALFFVPAITACVEQDTFESVYQDFSIVWNQPWRLAVYEILLMVWKAICVSVLAVMSGFGFFLVLLPLNLLIRGQFDEILWRADGWLGGIVQQIPYISISPAPQDPSALLAIAGMLMALTILFIVGFVSSYFASMASVGNTIIYVVLRQKISDENLLEVEEEEEEEEITPTELEEQAEEAVEESAESESQTEQPEAGKPEEDKSET
ncbi:TPA: hypothetical protein EYP66_21085 [Candidatus Poribacteria bacterium]|nr:hypothetical protein [Candidatus Poribacteria bacterium]